jgi:uncharacterized protein YbaP (TraB family)
MTSSHATLIRAIRQLILATALTVLCIVSFLVIPARAECAGASILVDLKASHPAIYKTAREAAGKIANTEAILWRVEKAGLIPSHLFGTMHVADKRINDLSEAATTAIADATILAVEIEDMSPAAMMKEAAGLPQLMVYSDGTRLELKLTPEEFAKVSNLLGKSGIPAPMAQVIRPWLISTMLSVPDCELKRNPAGLHALDHRLAAIAKQRNIPVVGLETVKSQLQAMTSVPDKDQLAMLRLSLAYIDRREDLFETLIQAYLDRDLGIVLSLTKALAKLAGLTETGDVAFNRQLLEKRNHKMFDASLPLVDKGKAFIAVGAAHLIGTTGLVALYRKEGFTVTAVN